MNSKKQEVVRHSKTKREDAKNAESAEGAKGDDSDSDTGSDGSFIARELSIDLNASIDYGSPSFVRLPDGKFCVAQRWTLRNYASPNAASMYDETHSV